MSFLYIAMGRSKANIDGTNGYREESSNQVLTASHLMSEDLNEDPKPQSPPSGIKSASSPGHNAATSRSPGAHLGIKNKATSAIGVYTGPGTISAHTSFEKWLGRSVLYATDYIDYKGGWQKDFMDSKLWLMEPWGKWVEAEKDRRLVLGLPMLQNANTGDFTSGIQGKFDSYFTALGKELVKNGLSNTIIRLGYEANCDTIGPWQATNDPRGYRIFFRRIVKLMRTVPGAAFSFDWTVCNGLQEGRPLNSFASFYPGDDAVDIIGIDIYDVKWQDTTVTSKQRWKYTIERKMGVNELIHFARTHNKPISIPEWGLYKSGDQFAGGDDNPYFVQKMAELINNINPIYQSYFNLDWGGGMLSDFPEAKKVFREVYGP